MKVGLNTALNCQPLRFTAEEQNKQKNNLTANTSFSSNAQEKPALPIEKKYELAKQVIVAQNQMIENLKKEKQTGLSPSNLLNIYG